MIRSLRLSLAALALALFCLSTSAHAQLGAYGMFTVDRISGIQGSPLASTLGSSAYDNQVNPLGFTGGVYYDFKTFGPVRLGLDVHGGYAHTKRGALVASDGAGAKLVSGLGGIRASFHTPIRYLHPYLQGSAGIGRSNYGILYPTGGPEGQGNGLANNFEYHVYAGTDLQLFPYADWRVFEAGYGALTATGNSGHTYPILSISTGVVFHFGR
jgi:hypothetical protein